MTDFPHKGINYKKAILVDSNSLITDMQKKHLMNKLESDGQCLKNALMTAKATNSLCVEGFVYCLAANGKKVDEYVIRHCWNVKNDVHFDVTKDFIWDKLTNSPKEFHHFIVDIFDYNKYYKIKENKKIDFLSNAAKIAEEINNLLKQ